MARQLSDEDVEEIVDRLVERLEVESERYFGRGVLAWLRRVVIASLIGLAVYASNHWGINR